MSNSETLKSLLVDEVLYELTKINSNNGYLKKNTLNPKGVPSFSSTIYSINSHCHPLEGFKWKGDFYSFKYPFIIYEAVHTSQMSASPSSFVKSFIGSYSSKLFRSDNIITDSFTVWDSLADNYYEAFLLVITTDTLKIDNNICIWLNSDLFYRTSLHKKIQKYVVEPLLEASKQGKLKVKIIYTTSENIFNNIFHPVEVKKESVYKVKTQIKKSVQTSVSELLIEKDETDQILSI